MSILVNLITYRGTYRSLQADKINVPSADGRRAILPNHVSVIMPLDIGVLNVTVNQQEMYFAISNGMLLFENNTATILSDSIIDVDVFNFEGKNLIYKIPAAPHTVRAGDMIVHQGKGMYVVADVCEGDTCISVIDPRAGESKEILFTKSPFGFTFIVKLVSLLDMSGIDANPDNPFGNLWPLAMMGDKDCDAATMMAFMMRNNSEGCNFDMSNPMMMYALMSGDNKDMLLPMMLMANRK